MTRLFNRKDKTTIAELEEYYSSTGKKNRSGMAWLWAFLSIILTVIIIVALFFLVRWIYRSVTDDDSSTTTVSETEGGSVDLPSYDGDIVGQGNQTQTNGGVVSDEAATVTVNDGQSGDQSSSASVSGATTPTTGSDIPNTGAGEIIILIPLVAGVVGYTISRKYLLKQNQ